jgi:hypothetical protein
MSPGRRRRRPGRPWSRYRPVDATRAIWGLSALAAPDRVVRLFGAGAHPRAARRTARILGLRDVVQATCLPAGPVERPHRLGALVDAVHVATMLALAAVSRSWRRPALTSASVSALLVLLGRQDSQPRDRAASSNRPPDHDESDTYGDADVPVLSVFTVSTPDEPAAPGQLEAEQAGRDLDELRSRLTAPDVARHHEALTQVAHEYAETVAARTRRTQARATAARATASGLGRLGGLLLVLAGIWLLVGQWVLRYPFDVNGQNTALRDTGFAVVVSLAGLRLWRLARTRDAHASPSSSDSVQVLAATGRATAPAAARLLHEETVPRGRGTAAVTTALVCGALLAVAGLLMAHATWRGQVNETLTGVLVLLAAAGTLPTTAR